MRRKDILRISIFSEHNRQKDRLLFVFHDVLLPFSREIEEEEDDKGCIAGEGVAESLIPA